MSEKYKITESTIPHFITSTVVGWVDVFTRRAYADIITNSLQYCIDKKGLTLHAWVIMSNHIHLIASARKNDLPGIIRDFKKYTSTAITKSIEEHVRESRKVWMLNLFRFAGRNNKNIKEYKFWQSGNHPVELTTNVMIEQRLTYLHENPVRAGIVRNPEDYVYSSATDYCTEGSGLISIEHL